MSILKERRRKVMRVFFSFLKLIILPTTPCPPYWKKSKYTCCFPQKNILKQNPMLFYLNSLSDNSLSPPPILRYIFVKNTGFFKKVSVFFFAKTQILVLFSNHFFLWHCACEKESKKNWSHTIKKWSHFFITSNSNFWEKIIKDLKNSK